MFSKVQAVLRHWREGTDTQATDEAGWGGKAVERWVGFTDVIQENLGHTG